MKKMTMREELESLQKVFKEHYGIDTSALDYVHEVMRNQKKDMDEVLGLNEENNYRKEVDVVFTEADFINPRGLNGRIVGLIRDYYISKLGSDAKSICFTSNSIMQGKNSLKISKLMSKDLDDLWPKIEPYVGDIQRQLTFKVDKRNFITSFMALTKCGSVTISTNPVDFLISSNESWGNCMRPSGGHYNGVISYMNDKFTTLVFRESAPDIEPAPKPSVGKYAGRAWCYVFPKEGTLVLSAVYGDLPIAYAKTARVYIERCIATRYGYEHKWRVYKRKDYPEFDGSKASWGGSGNISGLPIYFDGMKGPTVAMNRSIIINHLQSFSSVMKGDDDNEFESDIVVPHPRLAFGSSLCLKCGREHLTTNNKALCSSTCSGRKLCQICGGLHYTTNGERIPKGYKYVCPDCLVKKFVTCGCCGELVCTDKIEVHDVSKDKSNSYSVICHTCYTQMYKTCGGCGKEVSDPNELHGIDGQRLCSKCMSVFEKNNLIFDCSCGGKHLIDTICPEGGTLKINKPVPGKNFKDIIESPKVAKALASNTLLDVLELDGDSIEAYFVAKLISDVFRPGFAQQLIMTKYDKKPEHAEVAEEED